MVDGTPTYRMVWTDLDGTLLDGESCVAEETQNVLCDIIGSHCPLVLATARGAGERIPYQSLPGPLYLVACGGAHVLERSTVGDLLDLHVLCFTQAQCEGFVRAAEEHGVTLWLCHTDKIFVKRGAVGAAESKVLETQFPADPDHADIFCDVEVFDEKLMERRPAIEICVVTPEADAFVARVSDTLSALGLQAFSWAPEKPIVNVKLAGVDKASGLRWLCDYLGCSPDHAVAFGDGANDVPMLRLAGLGIAMQNAGEAAKGAANVVSEWSNVQHGVAKELLRLRGEGVL